MSLLSGRRHERGRRSQPAGAHSAEGQSQDRLSADRLANVLSLLHTTHGAPTMRLPPGVVQHVKVPESTVPDLPAFPDELDDELAVYTPEVLVPPEWGPEAPMEEDLFAKAFVPEELLPEVGELEALELEALPAVAAQEAPAHEALVPAVPAIGRHRRPARRTSALKKLLSMMGFAVYTVVLLVVAKASGLYKTLLG